MCGDQMDKMTKSCRLSPISRRPVGGVPVVGPIWRGGIEIVGSFSDKLDGLEVFVPKTSYSKVVKEIMQPSICFSMKSRHALWPKHFDEVGAAHNDIGLFLFPEISRSETDYDNLVEHMIANDLAMTSRIGNLELIIFTSLEQEDNQRQIQGKYYLWGIFKGNELRRCKPSKGKKTTTQKGRITRSLRALYCSRKLSIRSHIPLSGRIALSAGHQLITTTQSLANCDFIPPLSQGCKRARSKISRISTTVNKEADVCKAIIADFPDSHLLDFTEKVTTNDETKETEQHSWDSNMEIDEPSDSSGIHAEKTKEFENPSWDSDMEIVEPSYDAVKAPMVTTDPKNHSCLTLLRYKEESDVQEAIPQSHGESNSCLDEKFLGIHSDSVVDDHQKTIVDTVPGISEISAGLYQVAAKVDQPEYDPCRTPLLYFEEARPSSSSTDPVVLELDDDEEEPTMKGTQIFNDESDVITTSSMLGISGDFYESSSDTLRVRVGRYMIRSDLAPILTKILNKYGDIALGCSMMPEVLLQEVCKAFQDIEPVSFSGLRYHHLDRLRNLCQLGEALEIDMKWLSKWCDDLETTALRISQYLSLKDEMAQCNKAIQLLEEKVKVNRDNVANLHENQSMEEQYESLKKRREKMHFEVESVKSESRRFIGKSLVDGLF